MTLPKFLLARIAEDEARLPSRASLDSADQKRLRRECQAKRKIIAWVDDFDGPWWWDRDVADPILERLALPYADHPDFQEAWRP